MADISMCTGIGCKSKLKCHRYTATASSRQSMFGTPPIKDDKCDYFWDNKGWNDEIPKEKEVKD